MALYVSRKSCALLKQGPEGVDMGLDVYEFRVLGETPRGHMSQSGDIHLK